MKKELGIATIVYDAQGVIKETYFKPTMNIHCTGLELDKLKDNVSPGFTEEDLKGTSDIVMASWFNEVNKIELRDFEKSEIISERISLFTSKKGIITCKFKYFLEEKENKVQPGVN